MAIIKILSKVMIELVCIVIGTIYVLVECIANLCSTGCRYIMCVGNKLRKVADSLDDKKVTTNNEW